MNKENSLQAVCPGLIKEWHPTKNTDLLPSDISASSKMKVWWICSKGHEWQAAISNRKKGSGCPYCAGHLPIVGENDLATTNPELASEWHPYKNAPLTPQQVKTQSNKKVWWLGKCGHEWESAICNRFNGNKCPICGGKKVIGTINSLAIKNPRLAHEWHPTKNGTLTPETVGIGSSQRVWWLCTNGHEWQTAIYSRNEGQGCPYCGGRLAIPGQTDLATTNPTLASEWHPTKNLPLTPETIKAHSNKKVWWLCAYGHEWQEQVNNRSNGNKCPFCSGRKVLSGINDLATTNPALASEWHPTKNGALTANMVSAGSEKKAWWLGKCGHEWESVIYSRSAGRGCPICRGLSVLQGFNDLATKNPDVATEWHPTKNGSLTPETVTSMSEKQAWWKCKLGHEWKATIATRCTGHGCPICARRFHTSFPEQTVYFYVKKYFSDAINGYRDIFPGTMELDIYVPSIKTGIEYDGIAWHRSIQKQKSDQKKYTICKENNIRLIRISEGGQTEKKDLCDLSLSVPVNPKNCDLDMTIMQLLSDLGIQTPIVNTEQNTNEIQKSYRIVLAENSLSVKQPNIAEQWHPTKNGALTPDMFPQKSNTHVWWLCSNGHEWKSAINDRVAGYGCPYCANQKILPGYNDLATKNPRLAAEWHPTKNGELTPQMVPAGTEKKVWWLCSEGHEWVASVYSRNRGNGCPICTSLKRK